MKITRFFTHEPCWRDENGTVKSAILNIPLSLSNAVPSSQPQSFVLQVHQWMTYTESCLSHCNFISATLAALDYPFPEQYYTFYHLQIVPAWRQSMLFDLWTSDCSPLQPSLQSALDSARGKGHVMFVLLNSGTIWLHSFLTFIVFWHLTLTLIFLQAVFGQQLELPDICGNVWELTGASSKYIYIF